MSNQNGSNGHSGQSNNDDKKEKSRGGSLRDVHTTKTKDISKDTRNKA